MSYFRCEKCPNYSSMNLLYISLSSCLLMAFSLAWLDYSIKLEEYLLVNLVCTCPVPRYESILFWST